MMCCVYTVQDHVQACDVLCIYCTLYRIMYALLNWLLVVTSESYMGGGVRAGDIPPPPPPPPRPGK